MPSECCAFTKTMKRFGTITMLCQIVVTAIAISYVICVLLLSGLQKEDLDANTLAKLQRHNVNIYDMNNESLRQECLAKSYLDTGKDGKTKGTEDSNGSSKKITTKQNNLSQKLSFSDNLNVYRQSSTIEPPEIHFLDKSNLRNFIDEIKVESRAQITQNPNDKHKMSNFNKSRPDDINISMLKQKKDTQSEIIKDRALETIMKFWGRFTDKDNTKTSTEKSTTYTVPSREETVEIITPTKGNPGNAPSMEYVSMMIADFLRSQTTTTTTEASTSRTMDKDIVSKTIKDFLNKNSKADSLKVAKNIEITLTKELSDLTEIGKIFHENHKEEEIAEKDVHVQQKQINEDNHDKAKSIEVTLFSSLIKVSPETSDLESIKKMQALQYLNEKLEVNNKLKLNGPPLSVEASTQDSANNNNHYEKLKEEKILREYFINNSNYNNMSSSTNLAKDIIRTVSSDVIKEIADKVKEIVMKDIRKETPATERVSSSLTTTISESTTGYPTTVLKEYSQTSGIRTLMELIKELNTVKEVTTTTMRYLPKIQTLNNEKSAFRNLPADVMYPPVIDGLHPYLLKTPVSDIKQLDVNPFNRNFVPLPFGTNLHASLQGPLPQKNYNEQREHKMLPLTIQTNSAEIAPLVIQVSKPMKIMNQHIIVTTQNPFQKQREEKLHRDNEQRLHFNNAEPLHVPSQRKHHIDSPTYADLTKNLRLAENVKKEFRESYKDKIEKIKERIEHNRDKATGIRQSMDSDHSIGLSGLDKSKYHVSSSFDFNHNRGPLENSNDHNFLNRQLDPNRLEKFNHPMNAHQRHTLNEPGGTNHRENLNHPDDSNYRDVLKREYLSRLMDSNHHNVISQRMEKSPDIRRPIDLDHQSRHPLPDTYGRFEPKRSRPRYKTTKFHERLEQIENLPPSYYDSYSRSRTENCCDVLASRQQMPLNKVKEHQRFDDSHFRNFLKSQQKVTDMLERILAAKSKDRKESAEAQ